MSSALLRRALPRESAARRILLLVRLGSGSCVGLLLCFAVLRIGIVGALRRMLRLLLLSRRETGLCGGCTSCSSVGVGCALRMSRALSALRRVVLGVVVGVWVGWRAALLLRRLRGTRAACEARVSGAVAVGGGCRLVLWGAAPVVVLVLIVVVVAVAAAAVGRLRCLSWLLLRRIWRVAVVRSICLGRLSAPLVSSSRHPAPTASVRKRVSI